jgi:hypothetical protein
MVNKGGGAGVQVTAYTQTLSDIEAKIGNRAKAGQVIGLPLSPLAVLPTMIYLALPVSVAPLFILLPGAVFLGLAMCISAATFKKYL